MTGERDELSAELRAVRTLNDALRVVFRAASALDAGSARTAELESERDRWKAVAIRLYDAADNIDGDLFADFRALTAPSDELIQHNRYLSERLSRRFMDLIRFRRQIAALTAENAELEAKLAEAEEGLTEVVRLIDAWSHYRGLRCALHPDIKRAAKKALAAAARTGGAPAECPACGHAPHGPITCPVVTGYTSGFPTAVFCHCQHNNPEARTGEAPSGAHDEDLPTPPNPA